MIFLAKVSYVSWYSHLFFVFSKFLFFTFFYVSWQMTQCANGAHATKTRRLIWKLFLGKSAVENEINNCRREKNEIHLKPYFHSTRLFASLLFLLQQTLALTWPPSKSREILLFTNGCMFSFIYKFISNLISMWYTYYCKYMQRICMYVC